MKYITPLSSSSETASLYQQIKRDFGLLAEPFTLHSPYIDLMAGMWMMTREIMLVGRVQREHKEIVAVVVSQLNDCPYCVDAHTIMLKAGGHGSSGSSKDSIIAWTSATRSPNDPLLKQPPFSQDDAPEYIGTALLFHYVNRLVTILLPSTPLVSRQFKMSQTKAVGLYLARTVRRTHNPGESLPFLPSADLPADFGWAKRSSLVADALARWISAIERSGERVLDPIVRQFLVQHLAHWSGSDPGLGTAWLEDSLRHLPDEQKVVGRLSLLAALAPYRITETDVLAFREKYPDDATLIAVLAWASFQAVRRINQWIVPQDWMS